MKCIVVKDFTDLTTNYVYRAGDKFPRRGTVKKKRFEELSTDKNKRKEVLIRTVDDE